MLKWKTPIDEIGKVNERAIEQAKWIARSVALDEARDPMPFDVLIRVFDNGGTPMIFFYLPDGTTEQQTSYLVDWIKLHYRVSTSRRVVDENTGTFDWDIHCNKIIDGDDYFSPFFIINNANPGSCRLVKKRKTVTFYEAVGAGCGGEK